MNLSKRTLLMLAAAFLLGSASVGALAVAVDRFAGPGQESAIGDKQDQAGQNSPDRKGQAGDRKGQTDEQSGEHQDAGEKAGST